MVNNETRERLKKVLSDYIKTRKMRQTPERFTILDKVLEQHAHFDIDELYTSIDSEFHVSKSTVYNTIELLCECGILRKHFLNENQAAYELSEDRHLHLICLECGSVEEVSDNCVAEYISGLKFKGFKATFSSTNIYGICYRCNKTIQQN